MDKVCKEFEVDFEYFVEDKSVYNVSKNIGGAVGNNATINNTMHEGILENLLKRIEALEQKLK
jgi:hypothetical protein